MNMSYAAFGVSMLDKYGGGDTYVHFSKVDY